MTSVNVSLIEVKTIDYSKDRHTGQLNLTATMKASDCAGLRGVIKIAVGVRDMLIRNIETWWTVL